ncbi:DNA helicase, UvrD/REP type, partial [mine drainage metagenome]
DSQSIYSFRGAEIENILTFSDRYPEARLFRLEKNYRSTPNILNLANRIILHNVRQIPKTLYSPRPSAESPILVRMATDLDQARFVVRTLEHALDRGAEPGEIAVLYRAHYLSLPLQIALARKRIPFHLTSGLKFYEQAHIKDVLSMLRILENPRDQMAWKRILRMVPKVG